MKNIILQTLFLSLLSLVLLPTTIFGKELNSTNFKIVDPTVGSSGGANSGSGGFDLITSIGGTYGDERLTSGTYAIGSGFPNGIQSNAPVIRCLESITNGGDTACTEFPGGNGAQGECGGVCTDRAKIEVDPRGNPVDALYLVSVYDTDNAIQYYLQSDHTIGLTYDINDYMTICELQGIDTRSGSGCEAFGDPNWDAGLQSINIFTLSENVTYEVKVRALNGDFTEGIYSAISTVTPGGLSTMLLDVDIANSAGITAETPAPYNVSFGTLAAGVVTATDRIWVDLESSHASGISLYVRNTGFSNGTDTFPSEAEDLNTDPNNNGGYGLKTETFSQTSQGPLIASTNYSTGLVNQVGSLIAANKLILSTNDAGANSGQLTGGRASLMVKAKAPNIISGGEYNDLIIFTLVANL